MAPKTREFAIAVVFAIRSACHACDSQETVTWAPNCISCGSMLAYEVKLLRETIEKFALGIVFTAASASSIEWLIEHIYQKPAEVNDIASMSYPHVDRIHRILSRRNSKTGRVSSR